MTDGDWNNYVRHVVAANELYFQYGCEQTDELIECISMKTPEVVYYSVYLKAEDVMVGYVGITPETDNLEFHIFKEFRQRAFGTKAVKLLIDAYFSGRVTGQLEKVIEAETLYENKASVRLLEKTGFEKAAIGFSLNFQERGNDRQMTALRVYRLRNKITGNIRFDEGDYMYAVL